MLPLRLIIDDFLMMILSRESKKNVSILLQSYIRSG